MPRPCVLIVALTAGCGYVVGTFDAGQVSGTRLKLVYFDFDGTRSITGIYDANREENCDAALWINGRFYCTPTPAEKVVYADASCTNKVALTSNDPCLVPDYAAERDYSDCNSPVTHVYERGPKVSITQYWYQSSQGCLGPVSTRQRDAYAMGPEVTTTDLAVIERGLFHGTGRLQRQYLTSADGLRLLSGQLRDTQLNIECALQGRIGATSGTCAPLHDAPISYFQDATCRTPVAATRTDCDAPQVAVQVDSCIASETYFALGAALPTNALYFGTRQACQMSTAPPERNYFRVGDEIVVASPNRSVAHTGHRIEPIRFAFDGVLVPDRALYDTETQAECLPFKLADGNAYCLPFGGSLSTYYADRRCSEPVEIMTVYRGPERCGSPPIPAYALKARHDPTCANTHEVHRVIASPDLRETSSGLPRGFRTPDEGMQSQTEQRVGQLYELVSGNCVKHVVADNYLEYGVGPPISLDDVASGAMVIDL